MVDRLKLQNRVNQLKQQNQLNRNDMRYIAQILCRENESYTQTRSEILFDLSKFSERVMNQIKAYLDVIEHERASFEPTAAAITVDDDDDAVTDVVVPTDDNTEVTGNDNDNNSTVKLHPDIVALRTNYFLNRKARNALSKDKEFDNLLRTIKARCTTKQQTNGRDMKHHIPEFCDKEREDEGMDEADDEEEEDDDEQEGDDENEETEETEDDGEVEEDNEDEDDDDVDVDMYDLRKHIFTETSKIINTEEW